MRDFRRLRVWERAHRLVLAVYSVTKGFPDEERYGLSSQLRRASVSIPTNIAEGCGRGGPVELARFLNIAFASASEVEYLLLLSADLDLISQDLHRRLNDETIQVKRMLAAYRNRLRGKAAPPKLTADS